MTFRIEIYNLDSWFDTLKAHKGPGEETQRALDAVLAAAFEDSQAQVHVQTGSLKASGRQHSEVRGDEWSGEISYGGSAPGFPHDPVRYAREEFGRGEDHDAMRNVALILSDLDDAMFATVRARNAAR